MSTVSGGSLAQLDTSVNDDSRTWRMPLQIIFCSQRAEADGRLQEIETIASA